eukprot:13617773-Alexandrium_andersonii.AAC.1
MTAEGQTGPSPKKKGPLMSLPTFPSMAVLREPMLEATSNGRSPDPIVPCGQSRWSRVASNGGARP